MEIDIPASYHASGGITYRILVAVEQAKAILAEFGGFFCLAMSGRNRGIDTFEFGQGRGERLDLLLDSENPTKHEGIHALGVPANPTQVFFPSLTELPTQGLEGIAGYLKTRASPDEEKAAVLAVRPVVVSLRGEERSHIGLACTATGTMHDPAAESFANALH